MNDVKAAAVTEKNCGRINIRGVTFDNVTPAEALDKSLSSLREKRLTRVFTPGSELVWQCVSDKSLYPTVNAAELIFADGIGVVLAAKILRRPLKGKVAGVEFGENLIARLAAEVPEHRIFLLGGKPGIAESAAEKLAAKYPGAVFCGTNDGYFDKSDCPENDGVIAKIVSSGANVLYVCFGQPAQEKWINANIGKLPDVCVCAALGGSLDIYSGNSKRAPDIFIRLELEWFYRLLKEPKRIGRMLRLPLFLVGTLFSRRNQ